jgi:hypothetical protein
VTVGALPQNMSNSNPSSLPYQGTGFLHSCSFSLAEDAYLLTQKDLMILLKHLWKDAPSHFLISFCSISLIHYGGQILTWFGKSQAMYSFQDGYLSVCSTDLLLANVIQIDIKLCMCHYNICEC